MHEENLADEISRDLQTRLIAQRIVYHAQLGSTNDVARALADIGEPEGTLVIADEQTAGRGRRGRTWVAPAQAALLMSLILRPPLAPSQVTRVTMAVALGVCEGMRAATGLIAQLKWHNDVLLDGKKCAGVLSEASLVGAQVEFVIVGIGVNVNFTAASIAALPRETTTIRDELGAEFSRVQLAQAILRRMDDYYLRLRAGENLRGEWSARIATLGQPVRAQTPWGVEQGIAESVDDDGALCLRRADGTQVRLIAGDVTLAAE